MIELIGELKIRLKWNFIRGINSKSRFCLGLRIVLRYYIRSGLNSYNLSRKINLGKIIFKSIKF